VRLDALPAQGVLALEGPGGSGKSALLRRVAWSLGVTGRAVAWIEPAVTADIAQALDIELANDSRADVIVLVDDSEKLEHPKRALYPSPLGSRPLPSPRSRSPPPPSFSGAPSRRSPARSSQK
jgi:hypothetical protein